MRHLSRRSGIKDPSRNLRLRRHLPQRRLGIEPLEDRRLLSRTLFVDHDAAGLANGSSWQDAFRRLQDALVVAASGDEVRVAQGVYTPAPAGSSRAATFQLVAGVTVRGGYAGWNRTNPDARDTDAFPTVLSGDLNGNDGPNFVGNQENCYHVVTGSGTGATAVLDGFTITGGNANGGAFGDAKTAGGGLYNYAGSPTIVDCTFRGNYASWEGGGIFNQQNSSPMFTSCSIESNQANGGGGMFNRDGSRPTLVNCLVARNSCPAYGGGGIEQLGSSVSLVNSTFYGNSCLYAGAAIYGADWRSTVTATNSIFWGNVTTSQPGGSQISCQATVTYSCVQDSDPNDATVFPGAGNTDDDPRYVEPLGADNQIGTGDENVRLRPDSPCIDAGDNAAVPTSLATDLDGEPRIAGGRADIGAYEGPRQALVLSTRAITIDEGGSVALTVALALNPLGPVNVTVARRSGDTDTGVASGGLLMFNAENYSTPQTVTLVAGPDLDRLNGTALVEFSAPGLTSAAVTVTERDTDVPPILYVDQVATGAGTGENWANAYTDLQQALGFAAVQPQVHEIRVAQGNYHPAGAGGSRQATFRLVDNVAAYGGFASGDTWDQRDPAAHPTVLSGDLRGDDVPVTTASDLLDASSRGDNSFHVVTAAGCNETAVLDGFTITGGNADGAYPDSYGGGIYGGKLTLRNSVVTGNAAQASGGGIQAEGAFAACTISNNASAGSSGGFSIGQGAVVDCEIRGNWAASSGGGGSLFSGTVTRCSIRGNTAENGAGVAIDSGAPTSNDCSFIANAALGPGGESYEGHGGAIYGWEADPKFNHCVFLGNAAGSGGAVSQGDGDSVFTACQFLGNTAAHGGAIDNFGYNLPVFVNCAFSGNSAEGDGGAVLNRQGSVPVLTNCTFSANTAAQCGGGIASAENYSDQMPYNVRATNSIFWGNRDGSGAGETAQLYQDAGASSVNYSCVQGWTGALGGTGNTAANPRLVDADGPDNVAGTADDNLRLASGSSAIDSGDNTAVPDGVVTDMDGSPRICAGRVDMGACEYQGPRVIYVDDNAPADPGPGDPLVSDPHEDGTAAHPFDAIQEAIATAGNGDAVLVLDGRYAGHGNRDIDFLGKAITVRSQNGAADTVIDCGADSDEDHRGFYFHSQEAQDSVLEGFTITGGEADSGGGIAIHGASPTVRQCVLRDNGAVNDGGGIYASGGAPLIVGCTIEANRSDDGAGVACVNGSRMTLDHSTIQNNVAVDDGGGVYGSYSDVTVADCTIVANEAIEGGGLRFRGGLPTVTNCTIADNSAPRVGGGGIFLRNSNAQIAACAFSGNLTDNDYSPGGGAIYCLGSSPTIEGCSFVRNSTVGGGGAGVYCAEQSSPVIRNCSFVENYDSVISSAPAAGQANNFLVVNCTFTNNQNMAIVCNGNVATIDHCTIVGTRATAIQCSYQAVAAITNCGIVGNRAGIYSGQSAVTVLDSTIADNRGYGGISCQQGSLLMHNSIVWGNRWLPPPAPANENVKLDQGATALITYSDVGGGWAGEGNEDAAPQFVRRGHWDDAGTPGYPFDDEWIDGDYRLVAESPCIDAGSNAAVLPTLITDLDGNQRIARGTVDLGAYEFQPAPVPSVLYVDDRATGSNNGTSWANAFIALQDALTLARADADVQEIRVAGGVYRPDHGDGYAPGDRQATFQLLSSAAIRGGYAGLGRPDADARDVQLYKTVLSGDLAGNDIDDLPQWQDIGDFIRRGTRGDNSYTVVTGSGVDHTAVLEGVTISGGHSDAPIPDYYTPPDELSWVAGGGMYNESGSPTLIGVVFHLNSVCSSYRLYPGGTGGGGVFNLNSSPTFVDCRFDQNIAFGADASIAGGGMYNRNSHPTLTSCVFSGNIATGYDADYYGGAISNVDSSPTLVECLITGNWSHAGSGVWNFGQSAPALVNCTVAGNWGYHGAGGIATEGDGMTAVTNCILWANVSENWPQEEQSQQISGGTLVINHSCVQGWTGSLGGTANTGADPRFVDPGHWDDGGTPEGSYDDDWVPGDYRLRSDSPCIDAGDNGAVPAGLTEDLAGNPRIAGGTVDMGAYEFGGPRTIYVDGDAAGNNNGTSWVDAFHCLQDALDVAGPGDQVLVAQGVYTPDRGGGYSPGDHAATFQLLSGVAIRGGYAGFDQPEPNARDVALYKTVFSGDLAGNDIGLDSREWQGIDDFIRRGNREENSCHVVTGSGADQTAVLDGVTIAGGHANGPVDGSTEPDRRLVSGGGMYTDSGSPTLTECTFYRNSAYSEYGLAPCGGGMFNVNGNPVLVGCRFEENVAYGADQSSAGGGMYNLKSQPALTDCVFTGNIATGFDNDYTGGGMVNCDSSPTLVDCSFTGNMSDRIAGAMASFGSSSPALNNCVFVDNWARELGGAVLLAGDGRPTLAHCRFEGNSSGHQAGALACTSGSPALSDCLFAENHAYWGGAMAIWGSPTLSDCTFRENHASAGGAVSNEYRGSPQMSRCSFVGNTAQLGGALYNQTHSAPSLAHCTFAGNLAMSSPESPGLGDGAGVFNDGATLALVNCLFTGNVAADQGGGLYSFSWGQRSSAVTLNDCTFAGNTAADGEALACDSQDQSHPSIVQVRNCILWDGGNEISNRDGSAIAITFSDVRGSWPGAGNLDGDPRFIAPNGDDGIVGTPDDDLRLGAGSPAIDAGNSALVPATVTKDLAGNTRFAGSSVDMGAYELQGPIVPRLLYVDDTAQGVSDGTSWADAFTRLQDALAVAGRGDQVLVAQGVYKPDQGSGQTSGERTATFQLLSGVAIRGGYAGFGAADPDARNFAIYRTVLSGDLAGNDLGMDFSEWQGIDDFIRRGNREDNSYTVVTGSGADQTAVIEGVTITGGHSDFADQNEDLPLYGSLYCGGGMYNDSGSPTVTDCTFYRNSVLASNGHIPGGNGGGGVFNANSNPVLLRCVFEQNIAYGANSLISGGGMYNRNSRPALTDCVFIHNAAVGYDSEYYGGAVANLDSSPTFTGCSFTGNKADWGGGMWNAGQSNPALTGCTFTGNSVNDNGGAMLNEVDSSPTLTNCRFEGNSAYWGGGAILDNGHSTVLVGCEFANNRAKYNGGALYGFGQLTHCTFTGNRACYGGAVYTVRSNPTLTGCTFRENLATYDGGAMFNESSAPSLTDCTFHANSAEYKGSGMYNQASSPSLTGCLFLANRGRDYHDAFGGGMYNTGASNPTLLSCTFLGNFGSLGGGMYNEHSNPTLINCLFSGNSVHEGGGAMRNLAASPSLINCTFSNNFSDWFGGGGIRSDTESVPALTNCILWGNYLEDVVSGMPRVVDETTQIDGGSPVVNYTCIQGWTGALGGVGNLGADPRFADADGPDGVVGTPDDNLQLQADSPCINAGDNDAVPPAVVADLGGNPRIVGGTVDMGAHEFLVHTAWRGQGNGNWADGSQWEGTLPAGPDGTSCVVVDCPNTVEVTSPHEANSLAIAGGGGVTIVEGGGLAVFSDTVVGAGGKLEVAAGASFATGGALTLDGGDLALPADQASPQAAGGGDSGAVTAASFDLRSGSVSLGLSGTGSLSKSTNGTVVLTGAKHYTGGTAVCEGVLCVGSADALPSGRSVTIGAGGTLVLSSGLGAGVTRSAAAQKVSEAAREKCCAPCPAAVAVVVPAIDVIPVPVAPVLPLVPALAADAAAALPGPVPARSLAISPTGRSDSATIPATMTACKRAGCPARNPVQAKNAPPAPVKPALDASAWLDALGSWTAGARPRSKGLPAPSAVDAVMAFYR